MNHVRSYLMHITLLLALVLSVLPTIQPIYSTVQPANPSYMLVFATDGGFQYQGCSANRQGYEEKTFTYTKQYLINNFVNWLITRGKNVEFHNIIQELSTHPYDTTWLHNQVVYYLSNPPARGVLVTFGHSNPAIYVPYDFKDKLNDSAGAVFPSQWARNSGVGIIPQYVADTVRNKPLDKLPSLVVMIGCHSAGYVNEYTGIPLPYFGEGSWMWAYKFDDTSTWVYTQNNNEYDRVFIGWLSNITIYSNAMPPDVSTLIEAIKTSINENKRLSEKIELLFTVNRVPINLYWNYIYNGQQWILYERFSNCTFTTCRWMAYVGGLNLYLDPSIEDRLVSYGFDYIKTHYPKIYNLIANNNNVKIKITPSAVSLKISKENIVKTYTIEWEDPGNYTIVLNVFVVDDEIIPGILGFLLGDNAEPWMNDLLKDVRSIIMEDVSKSIRELEKYGVKAVLDSNTTIQTKYFLKINGKSLGFLEENSTNPVMGAYIDVRSSVACLGVWYDTFYYLLKYVLEKGVSSEYLYKQVLSEKEAINRAIKYVEQRYPALSSSSKKYNATLFNFILIIDGKYVPSYLIKLEKDPMVYDVLVDAVSGNILFINEGYYIGVGYGGSSDTATYEQDIGVGGNSREGKSGSSPILYVTISLFAIIISVAIVFASRYKKLI